MRYKKWKLFPELGLVYCPLCKADVILEKVGYMTMDWRIPDRYRCSRCLLMLRPNVPKYYTEMYPNANLV
jgi:hypothetical protein